MSKCTKCGSEFDPTAEIMLFGKTAFSACYPCVFLIKDRDDEEKETPELFTGTNDALNALSIKG